MGWQVTTINRSALPDALLPVVRAHCRVDFADDDTILKTYTAIAIGQLEKVWDWQVFGISGEWTPPGAPTATPALDRWPTPVMPVSSHTAVDGDGLDTSAAFVVINKGSATETNYLATAAGEPFPAGNVITLQAGFATADELPPEALGAVLQVTGRLYEYRENVQSFGVNMMPLWMNDLLVGLWRPRA